MDRDLSVENETFNLAEMLESTSSQVRRTLPWLLVVYGLAALLLGYLWVIGTAPNVRPKMTIDRFMRDPAQVAELPFWTGLVSNIGVLAWSGCAGICLFAAAVLKRTRAHDRAMRRFFLMGGLLTSFLVVDDLFMIHEEVVPRYLFGKNGIIHVKEGVFYILYAVFAATFLVRCRATIQRRTDWLLLIIGGTCLALSIAADKAGLRHLVANSKTRYFIEDSFKFFGILGWTLYFVRAAVRAFALASVQPPQNAA